jgi:D-serine deaminase-like pyridoxal phosphate-dependent protein
VRLVIDAVGHLDVLREAADNRAFPDTFSVVLDIDAAWRPLDRVVRGDHTPHLGVRRSPLRTPHDAVNLARAAATARLRVSGMMAYEAQVAGLRPDNPGSRHLDPIRRWIRRQSVPDIAARRAAIVRALVEAGFHLDVVNGGGTGSLASTTADPTITEVTAGSAFLAPHLFDGHRDLPLVPAAFFAVPIVRVPDPHHVTCAFGGFIASGPPAADRTPQVHLPQGLEPLGAEGFGEVQTPFRRLGSAPADLALGDPVLCRHAKAGEMFEHFNRFHAWSGTGHFTWPTWRGLGLAPG